MPTYDYKCDKCGHEFEIYQSMKDDKLTKCPSCGENSLKRLIGSGGGLIFKGSGFYLTDYKNKPEESKSVSSTTATGTNKKEPSNTAADSSNSDSPKSDAKTTEVSASKKTEKKSSEDKTENKNK